MSEPILTRRFQKAMNLAFEAHYTQTRKAGGKNRSYFGTHLMAVCSYVQEVGGTEDEAIAAILHDSVEDQCAKLTASLQPTFMPDASPRERALAVIEFDFGVNVRNILDALTDEKLPENWRNMPKEYRHDWLRKSIQSKAEKLAKASDSVRLVKACDTLHNMRSLLQDRTENGPQMWKSFALGCEGTIWKMELMTMVFEEYGPAIPAIELRKTLTRLKDVAKDDLTLKISK